MPPSSLLRPLPVDLVFFAVPLAIGLGAFLLGRFFHRWSILFRAFMILFTFLAVCLAWGLLFHAIPVPIANAFSFLGGIIIVLCWLILGVIGISWATPNPTVDMATRLLLALLPMALIAAEAGGALWVRFKEPDMWHNVPRAGFMTQTNPKTCLPAAAALLLDRYGIEGISEGELAYLANTSYFGTDNFVMARALTRKIARKGVRAVNLKTTYDEMRERDQPFIAQVQLEEVGNHAVLVQQLGDYTLTWIDPLNGFEKIIERAYFESVWTGSAIVIEGMLPRPEPAVASK